MHRGSTRQTLEPLGAMAMRALVLAFLLAATPALAQAPRPAPPGLTITASGEPIVAFASDRDGCGGIDKPDAPARAIRLADGTVALFAPHFDNRALRGPDLLAVRPDCIVTFQGEESADPARFSDRSWVTALWTEDGVTVHALIHNEHQGHRHPGQCPTGRYTDCWFNALTAAVSHDGGRRFAPAGPPPHLVAATPDRADVLRGRPGGFFNPTGIVRHGGHLYVMAWASGTGAQPRGTCLMRTDDIADPAAWRGFDGRDFTVRFANPYAAAPDDPARHVCSPVGRGRLQWPVMGLVRHAPSGLFIAVMQGGPHRPDATEPERGVYVATSPDLLTWSQPALLWRGIGLGQFRCGGERPIAYPTLLDPESRSPSFDTVGDTAQLFITRFEVPDCRIHGARSLLRIPVTIARAATAR